MNDGKKKPVAKMDGSRRLLLGATSVLGGISAVGATAPFIVGMRPSRKTQAEGGPIKVEIKDILPGRLGVHVWRLKPIWILRRNNEMLRMFVRRPPNSAIRSRQKACNRRIVKMKRDL